LIRKNWKPNVQPKRGTHGVRKKNKKSQEVGGYWTEGKKGGKCYPGTKESEGKSERANGKEKYVTRAKEIP